MRAVVELGLWAAGEAVVAGVSGGADSTAMLACLRELPDAWRPQLTVAHLDHGLRPASADAARAVARLAEAWGLPWVVGAVEVRPARGESLEDAARRARYGFLGEVAARAGARAVAVGHHRDDRVETVLLRLLRGSGAGGLAGIRPSRVLSRAGRPECRVVRPLWYADRADVLRYLQARGLSWIEDESNTDPARPRNRVRHELLPAADRAFGAGARAAILRSAQNLAEDDAALALWTQREAELRLDGPALDLGAGWDALPAAIRHRLVQMWWQRNAGAPPLRRTLVEQVLRQRRCDLPGGWSSAAEAGGVRLMRLRGQTQRAPLALPVPGEVEIDGVGVIRADLVAGCPERRSPLQACGSADRLAFPLCVRAPAAGERLGLSAGGRRSIRELLRAAAVPPAARGLPRVVADAEGRVLWLAGVRAAGGLLAAGAGPALLLTLLPARRRAFPPSLC